MIRQIEVHFRRFKCKRANRGQFDRVRQYIVSRLTDGLSDHFKRLRLEVAKNGAKSDEEQQAMYAPRAAELTRPPLVP